MKMIIIRLIFIIKIWRVYRYEKTITVKLPIAGTALNLVKLTEFKLLMGLDLAL